MLGILRLVESRGELPAGRFRVLIAILIHRNLSIR
jgi:hypothetical protein